jgi:hypothetical protein
MVEALGIVAVIAFIAISVANSREVLESTKQRDRLRAAFCLPVQEQNWCTALV